ncbi:MAG: M23 family metallopeptidase [Minisyncoccia bacterium]
MKKLLMVVLLCVANFGQTAIAGTKPIANMPDYNGTYYGTPATGGDCDSATANCDSTAGRKMFTTLYRDNYNRTSGCAGERCGKHPGVDIAVVSGTPVLAALSGTVVRRDTCDSTWGGLVVIEVNSPYVAGEKAYLGYAHLRSVSAPAVGAPVAEGLTIGESGGALSDPCHGTSTGSHLHFQVDKPHADPYPWYPTGRVEDSDDIAIPEVPQYTHNPLPFVLGYAYFYTFAENNNKELWGAMFVNAYNATNSDLWIDSSSVNPYVGRGSFFGDVACGETAVCSREITLNADVFKHLVLALDFRCVTNPVVIWYRKPDNAWHNGTFNYDSARVYNLGMSGLADWNGIITDLMIQPSQGCTASPGPEEYFIKQMYLVP